MDEKEILQQIAIYMQKRYNGFSEIANITNQLQDALGYNDVVTIRMLIKMRQQEMEEIDRYDKERLRLFGQLEPESYNALKNGDILHFSGESRTFAERIVDLYQKIQRMLEKLIEQDQRVNRRLAGEKSYYHQK